MQQEIKMKVSEFLDKLCNVSRSYHWTVNDHNKVIAEIQSGPYRGFTLNPVTALAHKAGFGFISDTRNGTEYAASLLGLPRSVARYVYRATLGSDNHGNTQVVRGKIRSVLEV
jgi:hypothetical protein